MMKCTEWKQEESLPKHDSYNVVVDSSVWKFIFFTQLGDNNINFPSVSPFVVDVYLPSNFQGPANTLKSNTWSGGNKFLFDKLLFSALKANLRKVCSRCHGLW